MTTAPIGYFSPVWSPNGSKLAFISDRSGTQEIWMADKEGESLLQVTNNDIDEWFVIWE